MLVGIAKLAAAAPMLEAKRRVEYRELPARSFLTRCTSARMPFEWTINPYRGCEFGCKYCYARYTHEFMELREPADFEEKIFAKLWNPDAFRNELKRVRPGESIAIGSATDPYQPAERRYGVMRKILEVFAEKRGYQLSITTKSDLVARDADLLAAIGRHNRVFVCHSITTLDPALARDMEPYAPRPDLRMDALRRLSGAGVEAGVFAMPLLPLINDSARSLDALAKAASRSGAKFFAGGVLFLRPCSQHVFFPWLEQRFPHLARRYHHRYTASRFFLSGEYPQLMRERVEAVRSVYGLNRRPVEYRYEDPQLSLSLDFTME